MNLDRFAIAALLLLAVASHVAAQGSITVTLTGTCSGATVNQTYDYINFSLSNSGTGPASSVTLVPDFTGATPTNSTVTVSLIAPGNTSITRFYLGNLSNSTLPGSYVEYITAEYSQGSSGFATVFSCMVDILRQTQSLVQILNISRTKTGENVTVLNLADYPVSANITLYASPAFQVEPKAGFVSTVAPESQETLQFNVTTPSYENASFPLIAAVSYANGGYHYAASRATIIAFASPGAGQPPRIPIATIAVAVMIALLLVLIARSLLRRAPPKASPMAAHNKVAQ